jgi:hypothetical protein
VSGGLLVDLKPPEVTVAAMGRIVVRNDVIMVQSADRRRSLEDLEGARWGQPPADATRLIAEAHRLRQVPVADLTVEDLRLLIGQQIGLEVLVSVAIEVLQRDPLAEGHMFEGDLLCAVLRIESGFWEPRRVLADQVRSILDSLVDPPSAVVAEMKRFQQRS